MVTIRSIAGWPSSHAAPRRLVQQTLRLQEQLRPGVAPPVKVVAHQILVEMSRGEAPVTGSIQTFDLRFVVRRHTFAGRTTQAAVQKPRLALLLEAATPTAKRSFAHPQHLSRLDLVELIRLILPQHTPEPDHTHTLQGF
jgi:hypothetical protein